MVLGYEEFWTQVFVKLGLLMHDAFASSLCAHDQKKEKKSKMQKSSKGKLKRRKNKLEKFSIAHHKQMDDAKTGKRFSLTVKVTLLLYTMLALPTCTLKTFIGYLKHRSFPLPTSAKNLS